MCGLIVYCSHLHLGQHLHPFYKLSDSLKKLKSCDSHLFGDYDKVTGDVSVIKDF